VTFWLRYIVRSLRRSGRRVLFALLCVAVGVASVVALQTATLTVQAALTSNVRAANGGDISVAAQASPITSSDLAIFRTLQRQGKITQWTAVTDLHATSVSTSGSLVPMDVQGVAPAYPIGGQPTFDTPSNGNVQQLLNRPGDVLVTTVLAQLLGVHVGSRIFVRSIGTGGMHATIRGILAETSFEHSAILTASQRDVAKLSRGMVHYAAVYVNVPGQPGPVASILRAHFPVATVQTVQQALQSAQQQVHDFKQFMLLVGLMALLIAGIGILNAMQSMLAWRRLEIAMLKAMGYPRGALYAMFGGEALLLGILGGVAGTALGAVVSKAITSALATALAVTVVFKLDGATLLGGVALGVGATLLFSLMPIVRAAAYRPIEILREGTAITPASAAATLVLLFVILALFGALSAIIMGDPLLAAEFVGISGALALLFTGVFSVAVGWIGTLAAPRSRPLGWAVLVVALLLTVVAIRRGSAIAPLFALATLVWAWLAVLPEAARLPLIIAVRSLARRRARTAVTLVAFLVGVLAMSVTLTVALSLNSQINQLLASTSRVNLVAVGSPSDQGKLQRASRRLPGVKALTDVVVAQTEPTKINGRPLAQVIGPAQSSTSGDPEDRSRPLSGLTGLNLGSGATANDVRVVLGRTLGRSDAGTDNALVRTQLLEAPYALRLGDTVTLQEAGTSRTVTLHVVGFYRRPRSSRGFGSFFEAPIFTDRAVPLALGGQDAEVVFSYAIDSKHLTKAATELQRNAPGALVIDIGDLTAVVQTILDELLNLLAVITALSLGAGLSVVGNGVALSMLERQREIALYKAIGFGPGSVLRFVLVENALAGTLAGAVSVLMVVATLGLISRVALQKAIGFDPLIAVLVLLGATALAVGTAYLAARTPIRVRPIEVLRNE
jgi:putative ABC transport system permease protein